LRIAFDEQTFQLQSYGGISRYITRLAEELRAGGDDVRAFAPVHRNRHLFDSRAFSGSGWFVPRFPPKTSRAIAVVNRTINRWQIPRWRPDIVHETYYARSSLGKIRCPVIVTVHDMIHERFPDLFDDNGAGRRVKQLALRRADHAICVSETTRRDLCQILDFPSERTSVVHHGVDTPHDSPDTSATVQRDGRPFILYVGLRSGYKNFFSLVEAMARSARLRSEFDLVAFGGGAFHAKELAAAAACGFPTHQLRHAGRADATLRALYQTAAAMVYPSLYEGFGMPLLEALANRCPVACGFEGPSREVVGDCAAFFDPRSPEDIASAIERIVFTPSRRDALTLAGYERARCFSWKRCAIETRAVYNRMIGRETQPCPREARAKRH
jgi:glycosyltransferase involved in cell wall biosynthesis